MERTNSPIFVERGDNYVLEEEVPMLDRLDIIEDRLKVLENKIDECCKSPNVSPRFRSSSISTNSGRTSPIAENTALREMEKSFNDLALLSRQQQQQQKQKTGGKRKTKKNKNKRKNKRNRTRRYKK